jgi:hypothetical protein
MFYYYFCPAQVMNMFAIKLFCPSEENVALKLRDRSKSCVMTQKFCDYDKSCVIATNVVRDCAKSGVLALKVAWLRKINTQLFMPR